MLTKSEPAMLYSIYDQLEWNGVKIAVHMILSSRYCLTYGNATANDGALYSNSWGMNSVPSSLRNFKGTIETRPLLKLDVTSFAGSWEKSTGYCASVNIRQLNRSARQYFRLVKLYMKYTTSVLLATGTCIVKRDQFSLKIPIALHTDQRLNGWRQTPGRGLTVAKHVVSGSALKLASP